MLRTTGYSGFRRRVEAVFVTHTNEVGGGWWVVNDMMHMVECCVNPRSFDVEPGTEATQKKPG